MLGVSCDLKLRVSLQASCDKTLVTGGGLSGSSDHRHGEHCSLILCDQCYKASLVSLYFLVSFWCFVQKDNKYLKLLYFEIFLSKVKKGGEGSKIHSEEKARRRWLTQFHLVFSLPKTSWQKMNTINNFQTITEDLLCGGSPIANL